MKSITRIPKIHTVQPYRLRESQVDISRQVSSEKQIAAVKYDITRRGHVETGNDGDDTLGRWRARQDLYVKTLVRLHIEFHDVSTSLTSPESKFPFQHIVQKLFVLTRISVVY